MKLPPYICSTCCGGGELGEPLGWDDPGGGYPCDDCQATGYHPDYRMWVAVVNAHNSAYAPDTVRALAEEYK